MSEATKERIKNETSPYAIATLLMAEEVGTKVSESTLILLRLDTEEGRNA